MKRLASVMTLMLFLLWSAGVARAEAVSRPREPIVGLPCEGCESVFDGLPASASLTSASRIAPATEPGQAMRIVGRTLDAAGKPVAGVIVYAYHTNDRGIYPTDDRFKGRPAYRHGRLRGWAISDKEGRYRFDTIRPAGYPGTDIPEHVHMHVIEVGRCSYYIDEIHFEDDPRLTPEKRRGMESGRGGSGIVKPTKDVAGVWHVTRDIVLGQEVSGYPGRADAK